MWAKCDVWCHKVTKSKAGLLTRCFGSSVYEHKDPLMCSQHVFCRKTKCKITTIKEASIPPPHKECLSIKIFYLLDTRCLVLHILSKRTLEVSSCFITLVSAEYWIGFTSVQFVMSQIMLPGPPLRIWFSVSSHPLSNSARTLLCTAKLKHSTVGWRRKHTFTPNGDFSKRHKSMTNLIPKP